MIGSIKSELKPFDASKWKIGIVAAQFNADITQKLLDGAVQRAIDYQLTENSINVVTVAGSVEIPLALQHMAKSGEYDALLAIGCIIKGETAHFEYVCKFVSEGILRVQLDHDIAIGFGVLTCYDKSQAIARTELGGEYLDAALQLAKITSSSSKN